MLKKSGVKCIVFAMITFAFLVFAILLGPMDIFRHGYFYDEINMEEAKEDLREPISLAKCSYEIEFTPVKKYFAGYEMQFTNQAGNEDALITMTVYDKESNALCSENVSADKLEAGKWHKFYCDAKLKVGDKYRLVIESKDEHAPALVSIDTDYLGEECLSGDAAIVFAYKQSTFDIKTKTLFLFWLFALWLILMTFFVPKQKKSLQPVAIFVMLTTILTWNYLNSTMLPSNSNFGIFESGSECLVTGRYVADREGIQSEKKEERGYNLGRYFNDLGADYLYPMKPYSDEEWKEGYSISKPAIIINDNVYTQTIITDLADVQFENGERFNVSEIKKSENSIIINLDAERVLNSQKYGKIENVLFFDSKGNLYPKGMFEAYQSQYGLQRVLFWGLKWEKDYESAQNVMNLLCALLTAIVFVSIVFVISRKYNWLMAITFYLVFWLSPWLVNFAKNGYWVVFTWFVPMLVGLICSYSLDNRKYRVVCYIAAFLSIMVKSLCGYEYISSVMLGLITFLVTDLGVAIWQKDKTKSVMTFKVIFIMGVMALAGFATAICIHAMLRGNGELLVGIKRIIDEDVLRRTVGGDMNNFDEVLWASFNAPAWKVCCSYFKFSTEIVAGIPGRLFPLLCVAPIGIFVNDFAKKKLRFADVMLYGMLLITPMSWYALAKSHSYIHGHLNFVLWYFGFVQICFYIVFDKISQIYKGIAKKRN